MYEHSVSERNGRFPAGPDMYRSTCYERDNENGGFRVLHSEIEEESVCLR